MSSFYNLEICLGDLMEVVSYWLNPKFVVEKNFCLTVPPMLRPGSEDPESLNRLARILPTELAKQELFEGHYNYSERIEIPPEVVTAYREFRPTPIQRLQYLERAFGLPSNVQIWVKREDLNKIGCYKLNSSYAQAYFATKEQISELVADTGPGNWGLGMALACKRFGMPITIYMERENLEKQIAKVLKMREFGATIVPISTQEGSIAASLSVSIKHVMSQPNIRLSLGCLSAYSALHNTVIGLELDDQLKDLRLRPKAVVGVVGGGSSFSGLALPLFKRFQGDAKFVAVESTSVPSFTKGEYRYENPDTQNVMPKIKMYTLGNRFKPSSLAASGLNYHGKNSILSLLVHHKIVKAVAYRYSDVAKTKAVLLDSEGIDASIESSYAIKGAVEQARSLGRGVVVCALTGSERIYDIN